MPVDISRGLRKYITIFREAHEQGKYEAETSLRISRVSWVKRSEPNRKGIMKRIPLVLFIMLMVFLHATSVFAVASMDGTWRVKEYLCASALDYKTCSNSSGKVVVSGNNVYRDNEFIGTVSTSGNTVVFNFSEDYLKSSLEADFQDGGYDVEIKSATVTYRGLLSGNKIKNGKIKGNVKCYYEGYTFTIRYKGTFTANRKSKNSLIGINIYPSSKGEKILIIPNPKLVLDLVRGYKTYPRPRLLFSGGSEIEYVRP